MEEIHSAFEYAEKINVYDNGTKTVYSAGEEKFNGIMGEWNAMIASSHQMPAFGVSINDLTFSEMGSGLWVEFDFGKELVCCEMPFEKLLVKVGKEYSGFNLVRYTQKYGYDGRCFYLDLVNKNMGSFYDYLTKN